MARSPSPQDGSASAGGGAYLVDLINDLLLSAEQPDGRGIARVERRTADLGHDLFLLRHNYSVKADRVRLCQSSWFDLGDAVELADWAAILTPIELAMWEHVREFGIALWPQYPVAQYTVDFGNPVARIALECDSFAHHSSSRERAHDAHRVREMESRGWTVHSLPGRACLAALDEEEAQFYGQIRDFTNLTSLGITSPILLLMHLRALCPTRRLRRH